MLFWQIDDLQKQQLPLQRSLQKQIPSEPAAGPKRAWHANACLRMALALLLSVNLLLLWALMWPRNATASALLASAP